MLAMLRDKRYTFAQKREYMLETVLLVLPFVNFCESEYHLVIGRVRLATPIEQTAPYIDNDNLVMPIDNMGYAVDTCSKCINDTMAQSYLMLLDKLTKPND